MKTVTRIYSADLHSEAPTIETGIDMDQLIVETDDANDDFPRLIWSECERHGFYNDSDESSDILCLYIRGEG